MHIHAPPVCYVVCATLLCRYKRLLDLSNDKNIVVLAAFETKPHMQLQQGQHVAQAAVTFDKAGLKMNLVDHGSVLGFQEKDYRCVCE